MAPVFYKKLAMIAFFNAGLRVLDVRDPYEPKEIAHFIPSITKRPTSAASASATAEVQGRDPDQQRRDRRRGYIYIVDRANTGMHILELHRRARAIAGCRRCGETRRCRYEGVDWCHARLVPGIQVLFLLTLSKKEDVDAATSAGMTLRGFDQYESSNPELEERSVQKKKTPHQGGA